MQQLRSGYAEVPVGRGITGSGGLIELFVSEETGTWTVVVTAPQQVSCMIAAGEGWERMAPIPVIPDMPVTFRPHAY